MSMEERRVIDAKVSVRLRSIHPCALGAQDYNFLFFIKLVHT